MATVAILRGENVREADSQKKMTSAIQLTYGQFVKKCTKIPDTQFYALPTSLRPACLHAELLHIIRGLIMVNP